MKIRNGFVSNSSSCSFTIGNKSDKSLTIVDFVKENPKLIEQFKRQYSYKEDDHYSQEKMIESAKTRLRDSNEAYTFSKKSSKVVSFGDGDGDLIGAVFDYILRDGGESKNFTWSLLVMNR